MPNMTTPVKHPTTSVYYFRKAIPHDVREFFDGKREFKKSLGTKNLSEAKQLIGQHIKDAEEQISLARVSLSGGVTITKRKLANVAETWLRDTLADVEASETYGEYVHQHECIDEYTGRPFYEYTTALDVADLDLASDQRKAAFFKVQIDDLLRTNRIAIPFDSDSYRDLARFFTEKYLELERVCIRRLEGDYAAQAKLTEFPSVEVSKVAPNLLLNDKTPLLSEIFRDFRLERTQLDSSGSMLKTMDETESQLNRFISAFGDIPIGQVTKQDMREFRLLLMRLPKSQRKDIKSLSVREQAELAGREGLQTLSDASVRKNVRLISPLFTYANELDIIPLNPTEGMRFSKGKAGMLRKERDYTSDEVHKIFSHGVFNDVKYELPYGSACYWVPVLAYYTGARIQELTQLLPTDARIKDSIHYLVITTEDGDSKSVKNSASHREIPLHQHLIELGFLDFVEKQKALKSLFPKLTRDKYGKNNHGISKWFGKLLEEEVGLNRPNVQQFHAFRHTFKTLMRDLGTPKDVSDFITGHSDGSVSSSYGGVSLGKKKSYIDKINRLPIVCLQ